MEIEGGQQKHWCGKTKSLTTVQKNDQFPQDEHKKFILHQGMHFYTTQISKEI